MDTHQPRLLDQLPADDLKILASMRHSLQAVVAPEVMSDMGRTMCNFAIQFLDKLIVKHTDWPEILRRQIQHQSKILVEAANLLGNINAIDANLHAASLAIARQSAELEGVPMATLERHQRDVNAALEKLMPVLLSSDCARRAGYPPETVKALLRELISSVRHTEDDFNLTAQRRIDAYDARANSKVTIDRERFHGYLRTRFPDRGNIEIVSFALLPGGSSKCTVLTDVRGLEHDGVSGLVLRLDMEGGATDTHVINEVSTLQAVFREGFPVPELLWIEPDAAKVGFPFIVVRKVDAPTAGGIFGRANPDLCNAETGKDLARLLAKLHTLDPIKLQLRGALNSDPSIHPMKVLIDNIRQLWDAMKLEPDAVLESCLCWLEENKPMVQRLSLIHGDVKFNNILVADKKIACLLDWELSHLGDPIEDLSYVRSSVENLLPWETFLAEYRKHGGVEYSEQAGKYYEVWRGIRNTVFGLAARHGFFTEANLDLRWGFYSTFHRKTILESAEILAQLDLHPASLESKA